MIFCDKHNKELLVGGNERNSPNGTFFYYCPDCDKERKEVK